MPNPVGAVLVVGAGTGDIWPSLGLVATGLDVYLPGESFASDGTMAQSDNILPTNDYTTRIPAPKPMNTAATRGSWSIDRGS